MRAGSFAFITLIVFAMVATAGVIDADGANAASPKTVKGYIGEIGDAGISPYEGLEVSIYEVTDPETPIGAGTTDSAGYFEMSIVTDAPNNLLIKLYEEGLSVLAMLPCMDAYSKEGYYKIDLTKCEDGANYTISKDLQHCIAMSNTKVPVTIHVTGVDNKPLRGATVTIYHDDSKIYSNETDSNGVCEISSKLPTGDYRIETTCPGYESHSQDEHITLSYSTVFISLQEKEISTYGGMTIYHLLMLGIITISIILAISGYVLCRHNWKNVD